jgi:hypothetical protein
MAAHDKFYQSTKLFFYTLRAFGLAPYDFDTKTSKIQMKAKNYLILVTSTFIAVICLWAPLQNFLGDGYVTGINSVFLDRIWQLAFLFECLVAIAVILFNFLRQQNIENFLNSIEKFDQTLSKLKWKGKPDTMRWCNSLMAVFIVFVLVVLIYYTIGIFCIFEDLNHLSLEMSCIKVNIFELAHSFLCIVAIQFIMSVYCIYSRLKVLVENMR